MKVIITAGTAGLALVISAGFFLKGDAAIAFLFLVVAVVFFFGSLLLGSRSSW